MVGSKAGEEGEYSLSMRDYQESIQLSGVLYYKTNELKKKKQKREALDRLYRLKKREWPSWPWSAGRLGYRVPPAAMSRSLILIASPACD